MALPKIKIRFGIRSLIIAATLIGAAAGIFAHKKRLAEQQADAVAGLGKLDFLVSYECGHEQLFGSRAEPGFWRRWLGNDMFDRAALVTDGSRIGWRYSFRHDFAQVAPCLKMLPGKFAMEMVIEPRTDAHIRLLSEVSNLTSLWVGLVSPVPGADTDWQGFLADLAFVGALKKLDLGGERIDDSAIGPLAKLQRLEALDVRKTKLSMAALDRLRHAMPNCVILADDIPEKPVRIESNPPNDLDW